MKITTEVLLSEDVLKKFTPLSKFDTQILLRERESKRLYKLQHELICETLSVEYYAVNRFFRGESKLITGDSLLLPTSSSLACVDQIRYPFIDVISNFETGERQVSYFERTNTIMIGGKNFKIQLSAIEVSHEQNKKNFVGNFEELFGRTGSVVSLKTIVEKEPSLAN